MRTTVDTREAAPIPLSARVCRPTGLRWCLPHPGTAVLLAVLMVAAAACTSSRTPEAARPSERLARTVETKTLGPRMRDLTIDSPALGRTATVRLLLPRHFNTQPNRRWPVLWLLRHLPELDPFHRRRAAGWPGRRAGGHARGRRRRPLLGLVPPWPRRPLPLGNLSPDRATAAAGARLAGR